MSESINTRSEQNQGFSLFWAVFITLVLVLVQPLFLWGYAEGVINFGDLGYGWILVAPLISFVFCLPGLLSALSPFSRRNKLSGLLGAAGLAYLSIIFTNYDLYANFVGPLSVDIGIHVRYLMFFLTPFSLGFAVGVLLRLVFKLAKKEERFVGALNSESIQRTSKIIFIAIAGAMLILFLFVARHVFIASSDLQHGLADCNKKLSLECFLGLQKKYQYGTEVCATQTQKGWSHDYCFDALAINTHNLSLCHTADCVNSVMRELFASGGVEKLKQVDCGLLAGNIVQSECYLEYALKLPTSTKEELLERITVCKKIPTDYYGANKALCIMYTAKNATTLLSESEYDALCKEIPEHADSYNYMGCIDKDFKGVDLEKYF